MGGLDDLYREVILDHYRKPRNRGRLEVPPAVRARGFNSLCGDEVIVYVEMDSNGLITEIATQGQGCAISQASASMMSVAVKGGDIGRCMSLTRAFKSMLSIEDVVPSAAGSVGGESEKSGRQADGQHGEAGTHETASELPPKLGDLEALKGVLKFPVRIKCATLCWNTLLQALDEL